jgi:HK97 family phage major capsid protein
MNLLRPQIAEAFAVAFDYAALYDAGPDGTPSGGPFSTNLAATTKDVEFGTSAQNTGGVHNDLVDALKLLVQDSDAVGRRYRLTGWVLDPKVEGILLDAVDTTGRPIWTAMETPDGTVNIGAGVQNGRLLGRPAAMGELSYGITCGFGGDFSQCAWGVVGGISYDVSTEATVTINGSLTSLWENNLVAIRAEAEYGWLVNDVDAFVQLTDIQTS